MSMCLPQWWTEYRQLDLMWITILGFVLLFLFHCFAMFFNITCDTCDGIRVSYACIHVFYPFACGDSCLAVSSGENFENFELWYDAWFGWSFRVQSWPWTVQDFGTATSGNLAAWDQHILFIFFKDVCRHCWDNPSTVLSANYSFPKSDEQEIVCIQDWFDCKSSRKIWLLQRRELHRYVPFAYFAQHGTVSNAWSSFGCCQHFWAWMPEPTVWGWRPWFCENRAISFCVCSWRSGGHVETHQLGVQWFALWMNFNICFKSSIVCFNSLGADKPHMDSKEVGDFFVARAND